ncbi:protein Jumonji isoform X2 [Pieris napi]|uniref:protein Jumonji isoform X2 n=1 Tax=Pieris napi TaxID=78633 RepID=UPI001FB9664A|nr:protein Jumonji isoform X2 [Pieris napi]
MNKGRNFGAQRKFAAGAPAPNKCQTPRLETPTETRPDPEPKVHLVKKTPTVLLDRLTFNDVHKHIQPVVVLKRLQTSQVTKAQVHQTVNLADDPEDSYDSQDSGETSLTEDTSSNGYDALTLLPQCVTPDPQFNKRAISISSTSDDGMPVQKKAKTSVMDETDQEFFGTLRIPVRKKIKTVVLDAPVFRPTVDEFKDPLTYIEKILPQASKYGLCKVIPPNGFTPPCNLDETMGFTVTNQYVQRMFKRYGPATKELSAIKALLASQKVPFKRPPLVSGLEVDLPHLFKLVQGMGGLKKVTKLPQWNKVAEHLKCCKNLKNPGQKIKQIYEKYLLPYEVMTSVEKLNLTFQVEQLCTKRYSRMYKRAKSPLHTQKQMLKQCDSTDYDSSDEISIKDRIIYSALAETEDCIVPGRNMKIQAFEKVAEVAAETFLSSPSQTTNMIEKEYWEVVLSRRRHVCVNAASIDTGATDYGFPNNDSTDQYNTHPWNMKRFSRNPKNMLSFLGPVVGMTAPTLHLGMLFSTSCWHRDPHGLPWIEYMHKGVQKVWYGIDDTQSQKFRKAVEKLCPAFSQNKSVWLPSDIAMIPPKLLQKNSVSLCRVVQNPGEFIIVCPKAYSSSIATGYTISESVYFATLSWIQSLGETFDTLKSSCEPTMFSLEQLLFAFVRDARTPPSVLTAIEPILKEVVDKEIKNRRNLEKLGIPVMKANQGKPKDNRFTSPEDAVKANENAIEETPKEDWAHCFTRWFQRMKSWLKPSKPSTSSAWNVCDQDECYICRMTLYLSRVRGVLDKNSVLCPEHALKILAQPKKSHLINESKRLSFIIMYSTSELEELLEFLKDRLRKS